MNNPSPIEVQKTLYDQLQAKKGDWPRIAEEAGLGYSWLSKFAMGEIKNPTIGQLQVLHEYFDTA